MTSKKRRGHGGSVYSDMSAWADGAALFHKKFEASFATREKVPRYERRLQLREVKPLLVYSLMNEFVSPRPNGFYTFLGQGFPGDNLVWWDFFMSSGPHLIAILNGANGLEAQIYSEPEGFDVEKFLMNNIARYHDRVHARIKGYERHEVFANQYQSYRLAVEWLKQEVEKIDTEIPTLPFGFVDDDSLARESLKRVEDFSAVSLKFHVLAKSLVVNAAFMCDALVSTLLRVGAQPPLRADLKLLRPILRASFMQRLEVIHAYTVLFKTAFDSSAPEVAGARRLMEKRNKYVHGELSEHTRLDDVYFDGDFPLYGGGRGGQIADFRARTFMVPSKVEVLDDVANAERFDSHVRSMIRPEYRHEMEFMLSRPQLGYNTQKRVFSVPFSSSPFQLVMSGKRARTAEDRDGAAGAADSAPQETALASPDVGRGDSIPVR